MYEVVIVGDKFGIKKDGVYRGTGFKTPEDAKENIKVMENLDKNKE